MLNWRGGIRKFEVDPLELIVELLKHLSGNIS